jgi:hypothetical protein
MSIIGGYHLKEKIEKNPAFVLRTSDGQARTKEGPIEKFFISSFFIV